MTELDLFQEARKDFLDPCGDPAQPREWARFGFFIAFRIMNKIRRERFYIQNMQMGFKEDGSPFTQFEETIEDFCRRALLSFYAKATFLGEETGPAAKTEDGRYVFIIDPIDGTRSFLSGFDSFALTLGIVNGKEPLFSLVGNPATGDIAFRIGNDQSKIVGLPVLENGYTLADLPLLAPTGDRPVLVNVHPAKASKPYLDRLFILWEKGKIAMVKSVSGSPSWQIVEACKGDVIYLNTWASGITMPFDLVAAFHLLEGAGGVALGAEGKKVDPWNHQGIFLAGLSRDQLAFLLAHLE